MTPSVLETVTTRANAPVDPSLHAWGWEITLYLFLGGAKSRGSLGEGRLEPHYPGAMRGSEHVE